MKLLLLTYLLKEWTSICLSVYNVITGVQALLKSTKLHRHTVFTRFLHLYLHKCNKILKTTFKRTWFPSAAAIFPLYPCDPNKAHNSGSVTINNLYICRLRSHYFKTKLIFLQMKFPNQYNK